MSATKKEILSGIHPVSEALAAGRRAVFELFLDAKKQGGRFSSILDAAAKRNVPVRTLSAPEMKRLAGGEIHQGIAARVGPYPYAELPRHFSGSGRVHPSPLWVLMDGVVDPHNLGAVVRSALCAGVDGVIIPKDRAASATAAVSRASAGALEHVSLIPVTNMARTVQIMKEEGLWIAGLDAGAATSLFEADLAGPLGLVVGGEGQGVRPLVQKNCDFLVRIPQAGPVSSLNASAAAAVAIYEAFRQRTAKGE